jgi:uncharacterized protein YcbX
MNPSLARIRLYPIKSLDPLEVDEVVVLRDAGLAHDREFCLLDENGVIVNSKRLGEQLIPIRSEVDLGLGELTLHANGTGQVFRLADDSGEIDGWFSSRLGQPVTLARNSQGGFPDDPEASGPTLVSTATLREVASWFPGYSAGEIRRRFRANLEIDGVPAFWEDQLYGPEGEAATFRIGSVTMQGVNPCARCTVPTRNSETGGIEESAFVRIFAERRRDTLPSWAEKSRFDHYYRLCVNTRIDGTEAGKVLHRSDEVFLSRT